MKRNECKDNANKKDTKNKEAQLKRACAIARLEREGRLADKSEAVDQDDKDCCEMIERWTAKRIKLNEELGL